MSTDKRKQVISCLIPLYTQPTALYYTPAPHHVSCGESTQYIQPSDECITWNSLREPHYISPVNLSLRGLICSHVLDEAIFFLVIILSMLPQHNIITKICIRNWLYKDLIIKSLKPSIALASNTPSL